jgi:hypothetical protein
MYCDVLQMPVPIALGTGICSGLLCFIAQDAQKSLNAGKLPSKIALSSPAV